METVLLSARERRTDTEQERRKEKEEEGPECISAKRKSMLP